MSDETNIDINSGNDTWFFDQTFTLETKTEKSNDEYLDILEKNRKMLENVKFEYAKACIDNEIALNEIVLNELALKKRATLNKIKRILNVNHFIMHRLQHNAIDYDYDIYEFERPSEIVERIKLKLEREEDAKRWQREREYEDSKSWFEKLFDFFGT
jgi:hypothetical protein